MKTIDQLRAEKIRVEKRRIAIINAIDRIEQDELLPAIKEKYEGKYFKYLNRYDADESWWLYFYVSKVKTPRYVEGIEFQKDIRGEITVKKENDLCLSLLEIECTKAEFDKNITNTISLLKKFLTP